MGSTKSKTPTITLPSDTLEQLRCSFCKQHLSCAPIRLLPDGSSVCGRCSLSNHPAPVYRELALEAALTRATFPCRYKQNGCCAKLLFGCTIDHEARCAYQPFACPTLPFSTCSWQGSVVQVREHFYRSHPANTTSRPQIKLDVKKNNKGVLLAVQGNGTFLIKYLYDASSMSLRYDVRYFSPSVLVGAYRIRLLSSSSPDNNVNLRGSKCLPYTRDMDLQNASELAVRKFVDVLENSNNFTIEIDLPMHTHACKVPKTQKLVDYELLESLRCPDCQNYLALPIFEGPKGAVCSECSKNYPPSINDELNRLVIVTNYPCRWNDCRFIARGDSIRFHEVICPFQPHKCPSTNCKLPLIVAQAFVMKLHLFLHGFRYFSKRDVYTSAFQFNAARALVTTTKSNEIIVISHRVVCSNASATHVFTLRTCRAGPSNVLARVCFEHSHCKLKSRRFVLDCAKELRVTADMLPKCFMSYKKMSVVVEM